MGTAEVAQLRERRDGDVIQDDASKEVFAVMENPIAGVKINHQMKNQERDVHISS